MANNNNTNQQTQNTNQQTRNTQQQTQNTNEAKKIGRSLSHSASLMVQAAERMVSINFERQLENIGAHYDIIGSNLEAISKATLQGVDVSIKAYTSAIHASLSSITDGVNEGAYAAANSLVDLSASISKFNLDKTFIEKQRQFAVALRTTENKAVNENLDAEALQAGVTFVGEMATETAQIANNVGFLGVNTGEAVSQATDLLHKLAQSGAAMNTAMVKGENQITVARLKGDQQVQLKQMETIISAEKSWIDAGANVEKAWLQFAQKIEGGLLKSEAAANDMGVSMGYSGKQLAAFKKTMFDSQVAVSKWGKKLEDLQKMQNTYQETSGRNIQLSNRDFDTSFAFDVMSGQNGLSTQLASGMELFNHSVSDSNEMVLEMFDNVSKIGLNGRKFMKDIVKNLKLAEKYQFKGGVKGLMDMAKWAQQTRFNMGSLGNMIDKIEEGGLENLITQGANIQVLGGGFAMGADPLAMGWEAGNDPDALAKRYQRMINDIGTYDPRTGEAVISQGNQWRLRNFAKYTGQNYEDLYNQIRQQIKGTHVERQLDRSKNWTPDQKALITNKAQLNRKTGQYEINFGDGRDPVAVKDLTEKDMLDLMPVEERIEDHVSKILNILSVDQQLAGTKQYAQSKLEADGLDQWLQEEQKRMQNVLTDFNDNYETYLGQFKEKMRFATEAQSTMLDWMAQGNENIDRASANIKTEGLKIAQSLTEVNNAIQESLATIKGIRSDYDISTNAKAKYIDPQMKLWADKGEWADDSFVDIAKKLRTAVQKNDQKAVREHMADLRGDGLFDLYEDGMNNAWTENEVIAHLKFLEDNGYLANMAANNAYPKVKAAQMAKKVERNPSNPAVAVVADKAVNGNSYANLGRAMNSSTRSKSKSEYIAKAQSMIDAYDRGEDISSTELATALHNIDPTYSKWGLWYSDETIVNDAKAMKAKHMKDGTATAKGQPMSLAANNVIPIHDGAVARTDPNDHAIFAKVGGPFDKLFNGIFTKIDEVHRAIFENSPRRNHGNRVKGNAIRSYAQPSYSTKSKTPDTNPLAAAWARFSDMGNTDRRITIIAGNSYEDLQNERRNSYGSVQPRTMAFGEEPRNNTVYMGGTPSNESQRNANAPIKVEFGTLNINIEGSLGKSPQFMEELANDPTFRRSLVKIITTELSSRANGGRAVNDGRW